MYLVFSQTFQCRWFILLPLALECLTKNQVHTLLHIYILCNFLFHLLCLMMFLGRTKQTWASHRLFDPSQVKNIIWKYQVKSSRVIVVIWKFQVKSSQITSKNLQVEVEIQVKSSHFLTWNKSNQIQVKLSHFSAWNKSKRI